MLDSLNDELFDVIVIGGGIAGAGVARDASLRGLKVALFEKKDFASGTSSMTSKMLHGGLRYLRNFEFLLVREAALERDVHLKIAPHLAEIMEFIVPLYNWSSESKLKLKIGLILYDLLAFPKGIGNHSMMSRREIISREPILENENLIGGATYKDVKTDDARLTLANILSAVKSGATALNYLEVIKWKKHNNQVSVFVEDIESGKQYIAKGRSLVICGGPWTEYIEKSSPSFDRKIKLRTTGGSHIILKKKLNNNPILIINDDKRPVFLIPKMKYDLAGTTDIDYNGHPDDIRPTKEDVKYILNACNKLFPTAKYTNDDVVAIFTGLRALVYENTKSEEGISRKHKISSDKDRIITLVGGKLTTYRIMACQAVNQIVKLLKLKKSEFKCKTKNTPLFGGDIENWNEYKDLNGKKLTKKYNITLTEAEMWIKWYGSELPKFEKIIDEHGLEKFSKKYQWFEAQLIYSCRFELARHPIDFMRRRTSIMLEENNGETILERIIQLMSNELKWSQEQSKKMKNETLDYIETFIRL